MTTAASEAPHLNAADARIVADAVARALPEMWLTRSPVCTRAEAMAYARVKNERTWRRLCANFGLRPLPNADGCYSREKVESLVRRWSHSRRKGAE